MKFEEAMHKACRELGLDGHLKEINKKSDCHTHAEKIVKNVINLPTKVKNSFLFLDSVDFCFYQNGEEVNFTIAGIIRGYDKKNLLYAISKALMLCEITERYMNKVDDGL